MNPLALDIGNRYIGVAVVDHVDPSLAYRYGTIDRMTQDVLFELERIITAKSVTTLVLGVPYHMEDGSETVQTKTTREFISSIQEALGSSVTYVEVDETLTSHAARENLRHEGLDTTQEHAEAARIILQEFLARGI